MNAACTDKPAVIVVPNTERDISTIIRNFIIIIICLYIISWSGQQPTTTWRSVFGVEDTATPAPTSSREEFTLTWGDQDTTNMWSQIFVSETLTRWSWRGLDWVTQVWLWDWVLVRSGEMCWSLLHPPGQYLEVSPVYWSWSQVQLPSWSVQECWSGRISAGRRSQLARNIQQSKEYK